MTDETVADVVRTETARQTIILVFGVIGTLAMIWVATEYADASGRRQAKMQVALTAKRFAERQRDKWQKIADDAATAYNREKL